MNKQELLILFKELRDIEYINVGNDATYAYRRDKDTLKIFFQGSHGELDWWHNFDFPAAPYERMYQKWYCHRGFLKVWKSVEPFIEELIKDDTVKYIMIIGYSHGGALAQLCHEYCKYNRKDAFVQTYAFGAPRVIFGLMPYELKQRFEGLYIIINGWDIVPHLPPNLFGFRHVGKKIKVGNDKHPIKAHTAYDKVLAE